MWDLISYELQEQYTSNELNSTVNFPKDSLVCESKLWSPVKQYFWYHEPKVHEPVMFQL